MKIVVAARCRNGEEYVERFLHGYSFADAIVISDGGSEDKSVELLKQNEKVILHHFEEREELENGYWWNPDSSHINFVLDKAKELEPDWLIFDDFDCWPNYLLKENARYLFEDVITETQVNAFRLYMWGDKEYFPQMNRDFDLNYTSVWAWQPKKQPVWALENVRHGTLTGLSNCPYRINVPMCLLHYSWHPDTIESKLEHYRKVGFAVDHPFDMPNAGTPVAIPGWARS